MSNLDCAACTFRIKAGSEIQPLPAGRFRSADGRPKDAHFWYTDRNAAETIIKRAALRRNHFIIDYEHQTLNAKENGRPAPAAETFSKLEWRKGVGLFAVDVQWTERAAAMFASGEHMYISPVITYYRNTGQVKSIVMAAVTNTPATDGMYAVGARAASKLELISKQEHITGTELQICASLGVSVDAFLKGKTASLRTSASKYHPVLSENEIEIACQLGQTAQVYPRARIDELKERQSKTRRM